MCGICGFTEKNLNLLTQMMSMMAHRGPDGEGHYVDSGISLGHKRLSIIDLDSGTQPLFNEDGNIVLVANAEIYNYKALRTRLEEKGHHFYTQSDCEVIVHLYEEYGTSGFSALEGMFAFALWDEQKGALYLTRDRMGIKPLYYAWADGVLVFASEVKSILAFEGIPRAMNPAALDSLLMFKHVPDGETLFDGVFNVMPGTFLAYEDGQAQATPYWQLSINTGTGEHQDQGIDYYVSGIRRLLEEAVQSHMMADVPIGVTLSGGLDSSLVTALMARYSSSPIKSFSIGFGGANDELDYARVMAEKVGAEHISFLGEIEDFEQLLPKLLWHTEEPIIGALLPTYLLAQKAKEAVKVVLVGEGADELFGGYVRFKTLLPPVLPAQTRAWAYGRGLNSFSEYEKRQLYSHGMQGVRRAQNGRKLFLSHLNQPGKDRLNKVLGFEQACQLPNHHLIRVDKLTMGHSIEARVPFLDRKLVEFVNTIPSRYKLRGVNEKFILKEVAKGIVPTQIIHRRKQGMSSPINAWFNAGLKPLAQELLSRGTLQKRGYFNSAYIDRLIQSCGGRHILSVPEFKIYMLVMLELWHQTFIDPLTFGPSSKVS